MKPQKITMLNPDGTLQYIAFIVDSKKNLSTFHALAADEKDNLKMTITRGEFKTRIQYDALKPIPWA